MLGNRRCLLDKQLDLQNQIRGTIKVFGLKVGKVTTATYDRRIRELIEDHRELQNYIFPMLEVLRHLVEQTKRLEKMILQYVRQDQVCRLFMTIPGVGPLTALAFKTFVDGHGRFKHSRSVGAALGLTPRKYASGEVDYDGRITKCGDTFVRSHLFEAAKVLLARAAKSNTLKAWGLRIAKRSSRKNHRPHRAKPTTVGLKCDIPLPPRPSRVRGHDNSSQSKGHNRTRLFYFRF